jgi:hypothetical protein
MFSLRLIPIFIVLATACFVRAAEVDADGAFIVRTDGTVVPVEKIARDDYVQVIGRTKGGGEIKVKVCDVAEVFYPGRDANFNSAIEKRDEGRHTLAAMYFQKASESLPHAAWVDEQCNFGIAEALFQAGHFAGYKGRNGTEYLPPAQYYELALNANPRSRMMPLILSRRVRCLAEQGEFDVAAGELKFAERQLKAWRDDIVRMDAKFAPLADRAQAQLALAGASLAASRAVEKKGTWEAARDAFHAALVRCEGMTDLLAEAADGELKALLAAKAFSTARAVAERWVERFRGAGGQEDGHRAILASAFLALGKCQFADATELKARGQEVAALDTFAQARWAFLHVVAEYFDNEANVAAAHYFSGLCYDRLNPVESDAAAKARREWRLVVERFGKSEFKELAEKELQRH